MPLFQFYLNRSICGTFASFWQPVKHPYCHIVMFADDTAVVGYITRNNESKYRQEVEHQEGLSLENNLCISVDRLWKWSLASGTCPYTSVRNLAVAVTLPVWLGSPISMMKHSTHPAHTLFVPSGRRLHTLRNRMTSLILHSW